MDQELKQRLIGASVIIALAVIFVPMLFDGEVEQKNNQNISITIPDAGDNNLEVKRFELDKPVTEAKKMPPSEVELVANNNQVQLIEKDSANQPTPNTLPKTVVTNKPVQSTESSPAVAVDNKADIEMAEVKPPVVTQRQEIPVNDLSKPATNNTTVNQAFRVKLGSFSQQGNAEKVKSSLLQKNIKAIVEYNPGLKLYRVWSQELYRDESKANAYVKAVDQLKLNIGTPKVVTLGADEISQMASQGQMGWVVQLGSWIYWFC